MKQYNKLLNEEKQKNVDHLKNIKDLEAIKELGDLNKEKYEILKS